MRLMKKEKSMKQIILTGDRPTGRLHVGHYVGSLKERVRLQNSGKFDEIYIMIADAQALTDNADNPEKVRQNVLQVALGLSGRGHRPRKAHIFIQSMVPELTELSFYYMNLVTVSRLQRNPTVKAEIQQKNFESSIRWLLHLPISQPRTSPPSRPLPSPQARTQRPMIEQCCEIVHKFNAVYGETLVEPEIVLPQNSACLRLPGTDGKAKMSKSLGNCIYLSDEPEDIKKKIMSIVHRPEPPARAGPRQGGGQPRLHLSGCVQPPGALCRVPARVPEPRRAEGTLSARRSGRREGEEVPEQRHAAELEPIRTRRKEWEQRLPEVVEILKEGSAVAEKTAAATLAEVR